MRYDPRFGMSEHEFDIKQTVLCQEAAAVSAYLMTISVGVIAIHDDEVIGQGSGTCVKLGNHYLIATAAHVLNGVDDEDIWVVHNIIPTDVKPEIEAVGTKGGGECEPDDVAWIELSETVALQTGKTFVPISQLLPGINHVENDLVVLNGYPGEMTRNHGAKTVSAQSMSFTGATIPPNEWPESARHAPHCLSPDNNALVFYSNAGNYLLDGTPYTLPAAHGMSGGGLWKMPVDADAIWHAGLCQLIGITTEWNPADEWVGANQIQQWLELVATDFQDLTERIHAHIRDFSI